MAANAIMLSGNLTREPELKATPKGKFVLNFRIGVDGAGKTQKDSGFFDCVAWGDLATNLAESLKKGQRVVVAGELRQRSFEVNDQPRSAIEVLVQEAGPSTLWATAEVTKKAPARDAEPVSA